MAPVQTADQPIAAPVAETPPLAWMAGYASLASLAVNGILIKLGHTAWSNPALLWLDRWGGFARNLSVVAALVALAFCLWTMSSRRSKLPVSARVGIASFGWILIPIVALMTALPPTWAGQELVLVVAGLSHALVVLLILAGLHWKSTLSTVTALIFVLVASLSGLTSMIVAMVGRRTYWTHADRLANAFQWSGELAYLLVPLAVGFALAIPWRTARGRAALAASTLAAAAVATGMAFWQRAVGTELPTMVYAALHLDILPDRYVVLYAIPLGIGWAVTVAAALSRDPARRQMAASLFLMLSAGYAPRTPSALILTVLGVALLARAAIAVGQRER